MGEMLALFAIVVIGLAAIEAFFWRFDQKVRRTLGASSIEGTGAEAMKKEGKQ